MNPIFAHAFVNEVICNEGELSSFVQTELSNKTSLVSFLNRNGESQNEIQLGNEKYRLFSYGKTYTGSERVEEFFKGLVLTILTLGLALLDARVRTSFDAAFAGTTIKHAAISDSITAESFLRYAGSTFLQDPLEAMRKGFRFGELLLRSPLVAS